MVWIKEVLEELTKVPLKRSTRMDHIGLFGGGSCNETGLLSVVCGVPCACSLNRLVHLDDGEIAVAGTLKSDTSPAVHAVCFVEVGGPRH